MLEKREGKVQLSVWVDEDVIRKGLRKRKDGQTPPCKSL